MIGGEGKASQHKLREDKERVKKDEKEKLSHVKTDDWGGLRQVNIN
jgi:hypothetical protein